MFMFEKAVAGSRRYWLWIGALVIVLAIGFACYLRQLADGLMITGLSRDVTWGLYIAQFTFFVGVAASAVHATPQAPQLVAVVYCAHWPLHSE